jgi:hypothetical protein
VTGLLYWRKPWGSPREDLDADLVVDPARGSRKLYEPIH